MSVMNCFIVGLLVISSSRRAHTQAQLRTIRPRVKPVRMSQRGCVFSPMVLQASCPGVDNAHLKADGCPSEQMVVFSLFAFGVIHGGTATRMAGKWSEPSEP